MPVINDDRDSSRVSRIPVIAVGVFTGLGNRWGGHRDLELFMSRLFSAPRHKRDLTKVFYFIWADFWVQSGGSTGAANALGMVRLQPSSQSRLLDKRQARRVQAGSLVVATSMFLSRGLLGGSKGPFSRVAGLRRPERARLRPVLQSGEIKKKKKIK